MSHARAGVLIALTSLPLAAQQPGWHKLALREARMAFAMAYDEARGQLVSFGGQNVQRFSHETWEWDGALWQRREPATRPAARLNPGLAYDSARKRTVLFGGSAGGSVRLDDTWEWDGADWTRVQLLQGPSAREATLVYDATRARVLLFGGLIAAAPFRLADTWLYDGTTWTQAFPAQAPSARNAHCMAYDPARARVVLFGGSLATTPVTLSGETWEWDGANWQLASTTGPAPRNFATLSHDGLRGRTVLFGGWTGSNNAETWEWNGSTWSQRTTATVPASRYGHAAAFHAASSRTVMVDGMRESPETWTFDGTDWTSLEPAPMHLTVPVLAVEPGSGRVLAFGNSPVSGRFDSWAFGGTNWNALPASGPPQSNGFAIAPDPVRQRLVMFGGATNTVVNFTWEWNGTAWASVPSFVLPPARSYAGLAFDIVAAKVLMFGGRNAQTIFGDTWHWDGVTWTQLFPPAAPAARAQHAMTTDPVRQQVVLFGGSGAQPLPNTFLGDTWLWNGGQWLPAAGGPSPRFAAAMAFAANRQRVVLHGGAAGTTSPQFNDTWEWDGAAWSPLATATSTTLRSNHSLAFDTARGRLLLHGGLECVGSCGYLACTWLLTTTAASSADFGTTCAGPVPPRFHSDTPYSGNRAFCFTVDSAPALAPCLMALSLQVSAPLGAPCSSYLLQPITSLFLLANALGTAQLRVPVPESAFLRGLQLFGRAGVLDGIGPLGGISLTNGRSVIVGD